MNQRASVCAVSCCAVLAMLAGCSAGSPTDLSTGEFGLSGVAEIQGTIMDVAGVPLDSFHVGISEIRSNVAMYSSVSVVTTNTAGQFAVRVEQRGGAPPVTPDSILATVNTWSLKASDRRADGSRQAASRDVWLKFEPPPRAPYSVTVNIPVARLP